MNELILTKAITSLEVAEMVGKEHNKLLRDIRVYIGQTNVGLTNFFTETTYITEQNKELPCFNITEKGCEFIAHKLTGSKGTEFTVKYINKFHEMKDTINQQKLMSPMELLELQFAAMKEQKQEIIQVNTRVDKLENTMTIDYAQQQELVSITNRVATAALGGKKTTAYKSMSKVLFTKVWHDFKEYFEVNSYKNTPTVRFEEAELYLESWMPDTNMKLDIVRVNKGIA